MDQDKQNNIFACIMLGIIGDKIGFNNGKREFMFIDLIPKYTDPQFKNKINEYTIFMLLDFLKNGGIQGIDINTINYSDDTVMMLSNMKTLLNIKPYDYDDFMKKNIQYYIKDFKNEDEMINLRKAGKHTINSIRFLNKNPNIYLNWNKIDYSKYAGGSGGSMRSAIFGLIFDYNTDINNLIKYSISSCALTHMNGIVFLGSFTNALFTSFALNKINIELWIFKLIDILHDDSKVDKYIKETFIHVYEDYLKDKNIFVDKLKSFVEDNFNNYIYIKEQVKTFNPVDRILYYFYNFSTFKNNFFPGSGSDDSIIIAYDSLLMSRDNYERLIYLSMIHLGDSDTTGIIASNWYGALYGFKNVYDHLYKNDNLYDIVMNNSKKLYNIYFK